MPIDKFHKHTNIFVETGSYLGHGIDKALQAGFKEIHSIDIVKEKYLFCKDIFEGNEKVKLHHGDSSDLLAEIIKNINEPITFWLDGHFSEGDRIAGTKMKTLCPLVQEIEAIKNHPIKNHVIMIDDLRCWEGMDNQYHEGFDFDTLKKLIYEINPLYEITFIDGMHEDGTIIPNDILIAK